MSRKISENALSAEERELLTTFFEEAREAVHNDGERAPSQFTAFFKRLETDVFDPDFKIGKARKAAKLNGNNYSTKFFNITGRRPRDYVEYHRIMLAQRIIRHTSIFYWQVGTKVGYSDQSVFTRAYGRVLGYPPSDEAKAEDLPPVEKKKLPRPVPEVPPDLLDPRSSPNTAELSYTGAQQHDLSQFWETISILNCMEIKSYVAQNVESVGIEHFHYLLEKAKYEGRSNRARGEELGLAALDVLRLVEFKGSCEFPDEKAIAYANLANTCRLRYDFQGAEKWFQYAYRFLPSDPLQKPLLYAEVNLLKTSLLWWQLNTEAAVAMIDKVTPCARQHGSHALVARAVLLAGEIYDYTGHPDRAVSLFQEAAGLSRFVDDPFVALAAHYNLAFLYARLDQEAEAVSAFTGAREEYDKGQTQVPVVFMKYLEAAVCRISGNLDAARSLFIEARKGFETLKLEMYSALVALDHALLLLEMGEPDEALMSATMAISVISRSSGHPDAMAALVVLQEAAKQQEFQESTIKKAIHHLDLIRKDPTSTLMKPVNA